VENSISPSVRLKREVELEGCWLGKKIALGGWGTEGEGWKLIQTTVYKSIYM
jgi:hypothetical protein